MVYYYCNETELQRAAHERRHNSVTIAGAKLMQRLFGSHSRSRNASDKSINDDHNTLSPPEETSRKSRNQFRKQKSEGYHSDICVEEEKEAKPPAKQRQRSESRVAAMLHKKWTFYRPPPPFHGAPPYNNRRPSTAREEPKTRLPSYPIATGEVFPNGIARSTSSPFIGQQRRASAAPTVTDHSAKKKQSMLVVGTSRS